MVLVLSQSTM